MRTLNNQNQVEAWLSEMTLEEKASLCAGADMWRTAAVERLGVPSLFMADGPHGIRKEQADVLLGGAAPATCFPTGSALGSSWNKQLLEEVGASLGREARHLGVDLLLGPGINMKRSPLNGRNFEYYSEDPYLSGELGAGFVTGVQSQHVGATLKHFACNNTEHERMTINSVVDERTLREIYLAAFERIVKQAKPWAIMCSYNKVNGTYAAEHHELLTAILHEEWGFEGFVMSDWLAVDDRVVGLKAGLDLEMPGPAEANARYIVEAVRSGKLEERVLNAAAGNVLAAAAKLVERQAEREQVQGQGQEQEQEPRGCDFAAHHALARRAAEECIVLLKNSGELLPLDPKQAGKIAVIGTFAQAPLYQGGGSAKVNPTQLESAWEEMGRLAAQSGGQLVLTYAAGYEAAVVGSGEGGGTKLGEQMQMQSEAVQLASESDVAVVFVGMPEGESRDRTDMDLPAAHIQLIQSVAAAQRNCIVVINGGSAITMHPWIEAVPAVVMAWLPGQAGGSAIASILFGQTNPSGKLSETFPVKLSDNPSFLNFPGENGITLYGEGLYVGYRYYDKKAIQPQFPFGHGLSYSTFSYSSLKLNQTMLTDQEILTVSAQITNTGSRPGMEVVQLYVHDQESEWGRPDKELKGFAKVALQPGQTKAVTFALEKRDFSYYDPKVRQWVAETGYFTLLLGSSSVDIRLQESVFLKATERLEAPKDANSTVSEWLTVPAGRVALQYAAEHFVKDEVLKGELERGTLHDFYRQMPLYKFVKLVSPTEADAVHLMGMFKSI